LLTTDRPIAAIAAEAGFVDDSHLHHCFAKQYGRTPSAYRRAMVSELGRATEDGVAVPSQESRSGVRS
ncbi:MAG: helix-turn-helix domain-containing protein, partial [Armatimonadetes bacterium]|nr:helix-turn-helix domain-containing protein [Armatimonadota bacterium]